ncbi:HAD-like domain-containing protein [Bisporella sp. PMI_857]|nr:HAD-like domain-containing protein [Bisporella sp. PMI_857]
MEISKRQVHQHFASSNPHKTSIAFDLYGTLLSTESIAKELASHFGNEKAKSIAALWRRFQLEYTWRLNSMSLYKPFSDVTKASLLHALAESSETLNEEEIGSLMKAYDSLEPFPEVGSALQALSSWSEADAYVFSNGTEKMVKSSVEESPSLSPFQEVFSKLITVEEVEAYKPDKRVYQHLAKKVGKADDLESIWLVSANPFDVVGARAAGFQAAWIDRAGGHSGAGGWTDKLGDLASGGPTIIAKGVDEAVNSIKEWTSKNHNE